MNGRYTVLDMIGRKMNEEITEDEQLHSRLAEPFATIVQETTGGKEAKREHSTSSDVACSRKTLWVGPEGLEPPTSTV